MKREGKRRRIAVVVASMEVEYACKTLRGIEKEAHAQGMDVYIFNASVSPDETLNHNVGEYNIYNLIDYSLFDGVIFFANLIQSYSVYSKIVDEIRKSGIAAVSIDAEIEGFYFVGVENYRPMKEIVAHLIEYHGYTKINYVSGQDFNSDSRERLSAYCDALKEHGIPVEEERIYRGAFTNAHGRAAAEKMLETPEKMPQAVVCATDAIAIGARSVFAGRGIEIPRQLALTGFDDTFGARNSVPRITTVVRNQVQVGRRAVRKIAAVLEGRPTSRTERFPAAIVLRESCGCTAGGRANIVSLRRKYVETAQHYGRYLTDGIVMVEELNDSRTFQDFLNCLQQYVGMLQCDSFYLCLDRHLVENLRAEQQGERVDVKKTRRGEDYCTEGYPEMMTMAIACEGGKTVQYEDFPTEQLLPEKHMNMEKNHTYMFSSIHFRNQCMGYSVVDNSSFAMNSPLFATWMINLCNGLENLRKQAHQRNMLRQLDRMYVTDALTGLYNRFGFSRYAGAVFENCTARAESLMILFGDLDGLKKINDKYGHAEGDAAIQAAARALERACRGNEVCARFGGDEFIVCAAGYSEEDAVAYGNRLEKELEQINVAADKPYRVSMSYGYEVVIPEIGEILNYYVDVADNRMYEMKNSKKKRVDG